MGMAKDFYHEQIIANSAEEVEAAEYEEWLYQEMLDAQPRTIEQKIEAAHPWPTEPTALTAKEAAVLTDKRMDMRRRLTTPTWASESIPDLKRSLSNLQHLNRNFPSESNKEKICWLEKEIDRLRLTTAEICSRSLEGNFASWRKAWAQARERLAK